jgi:putative transposase
MRTPRLSGIGYIYHITTRTNNREFTICDREDLELYMDTLTKAKAFHKVLIYAFCLMNNHVHLIVHTPDKDNISVFMRDLNGNYAKRYNRRHSRTGHFWGDRFSSTIIDSDIQLLVTSLYVELNMVRAGGVDKPENWEWSSYNHHAYGKKHPIVDDYNLYTSLGKNPKEQQYQYRTLMLSYMASVGLTHDPRFSEGLILGSLLFVEKVLDEATHPYYKNRRIYEHNDNLYTSRNPQNRYK